MTPENNIFNVDTRDFHCGYRYEKKKHESHEKLEKDAERFFLTKDELTELLNRYYAESGGECKWRFFTLDGMENWTLKYIRIWRSEKGFLVCNSDNRALRKEVLNQKVQKDYLH